MSKARTATVQTALAAIALVAAPALTGASRPVPAPRTVPISCPVPHGSGPGYDASITNRQNGNRICITVGERLLVFLSAPPNALPWHRVRVSEPGILNIAPLTLMFSRGVTATNFKAVHRGVVVLTSQRSPCVPAPSSLVSCGALLHWQATVVVLASRPRPI